MTAVALLALSLTMTATPEITVPHSTSAGAVDPNYRRALEHDRRGEFTLAATEFRLAAARNATLSRRALYHASLSGDIAIYQSRLKDNRGYVYLFQTAVQLQNKYWAFVIELGEQVPRLFQQAEQLFIEALRADAFAANPVVCLAALYLQAGDPKKADQTITQLTTRAIREADEYNFSFYLALKGELDRAFSLLERVVAREPRQIDWILESDDFHGLHDHPRLARLIARHRDRQRQPVK